MVTLRVHYEPLNRNKLRNASALWNFYCSSVKRDIFTIQNGSCAKVMFSQVSVCLSMESGVQPPSQADTPLARQTPHPPPARQKATAADGTHPTGMHSCPWYFCLNCKRHQATSNEVTCLFHWVMCAQLNSHSVSSRLSAVCNTVPDRHKITLKCDKRFRQVTCFPTSFGKDSFMNSLELALTFAHTHTHTFYYSCINAFVLCLSGYLNWTSI